MESARRAFPGSLIGTTFPAGARLGRHVDDQLADLGRSWRCESIESQSNVEVLKLPMMRNQRLQMGEAFYFEGGSPKHLNAGDLNSISNKNAACERFALARFS